MGLSCGVGHGTSKDEAARDESASEASNPFDNKVKRRAYICFPRETVKRTMKGILSIKWHHGGCLDERK